MAIYFLPCFLVLMDETALFRLDKLIQNGSNSVCNEFGDDLESYITQRNRPHLFQVSEAVHFWNKNYVGLIYLSNTAWIAKS